MYDATGVRLQAGRQAQVLNQIVFDLPPEHPLSETRPLQEPLGHTPPQVRQVFFSVSCVGKFEGSILVIVLRILLRCF